LKQTCPIGYTLGFLILNQFLSMFTFKNWKKVLQFVMWNHFTSFLTCIFEIFPFFTPGKQPYFEISEMTTHTPINRARDIWWTLDFASAFFSPGVNSRAELVPSPRAYARNGAPRSWLGEYCEYQWIFIVLTAKGAASHRQVLVCWYSHVV
jgi:hypothetical protein